MIEEVRKGYRENPAGFERHLQNSEDAYLYKRFADEIHHTLIKTRRLFQQFLDMMEALPLGELNPDHSRKGMAYRTDREKQINDLVSYFIGIQKSTSNIVKGGLHLSRQGFLPRPTAESILRTVDDVMEEGKQLVVFCQSRGIPCFDTDFLRKVLTTIGLEGFKKIVDDEQFAPLSQNPELFYLAVLHQQGHDAFLQSKAKSTREGIEELRAQGEFEDMAKEDPNILAYAVLNYSSAKTPRNKRFSNAHDYLLYLREQKKISAQKKKKNGKKRLRFA